MEAEPGSVVTVVSIGLSRFLGGGMSEDVASSEKKRRCALQHNTDKTHTPPRRKERRPKQERNQNQTKETPKNTHKGMGRLNTQLADCRIELLPVLVRGGAICS